MFEFNGTQFPQVRMEVTKRRLTSASKSDPTGPVRERAD